MDNGDDKEEMAQEIKNLQRVSPSKAERENFRSDQEEMKDDGIPESKQGNIAKFQKFAFKWIENSFDKASLAHQV